MIQSADAPSTELDARQLDESGYLLWRGVFGVEDLAAMQCMLSRELELRAQLLHKAGVLADLHQEAPFQARYGLLMAACPAIHQGFDLEHLLQPEQYRYLRHPPLLRRLATLLGEEIDAGPVMHVRAKPPHSLVSSHGSFFTVPWHQDSAVLTEETDSTLQLTCWTPLVDVEENMGPVQILPIPRATGHLPHVQDPNYGTALASEVVPSVDPISITCRAGDVLVMNQFLPHRSNVNTSDRCRWSIDMRFQANGAANGRPWLPALPVWRDGLVAKPSFEEWVDAWHEAQARPHPGARHRTVQNKVAS